MDKEFDSMNSALKNLEAEVKETKNILKDFMSMSVKQWEQQQKSNELIVGELKSIRQILSTF